VRSGATKRVDVGPPGGQRSNEWETVEVNRTDRLYALVEELRASAPRARAARRLAECFDVSVRTIERDISALQQSGVPIWATPGPGGGYTIDPAMTLPPLNFSPDEATAIAVALAVSGLIPFGNAGRSALRKIISAMSEVGRDGARDLVSRIHLLEDAGELERGPVLDAVETAVASRRVLAVDYVDEAGHSTVGRMVEPFGLAGYGGHWYVVGWCRLRGGGRTFRLDRMLSARVTEERAPLRDPEDVAAGLLRSRHPRFDD
jgi:predicted DNA-binding transcriptional regulator YafY